ncbi:MAG TPA: TIGR03668 family PPOX class F420-dependent oxidoreductase [Candidatus Limnocylindrales bacterium]|nr:TIGR03668 family PPOX class F420-dependent oxidoreductase [Candidatus Limnocylindrales bacterium]
MTADALLTPAQRAFLVGARTIVLATIAPDGRPRLLPICFVVGEAERPLVIHTPLDEKRKSVADPRHLERVTDILARPAVGLLAERWSEDWSEIGWLRLDGVAVLVEPGPDEHRAGVAALRAKYAQYATHHLEERPIIRIVVERTRGWGVLGARAGQG